MCSLRAPGMWAGTAAFCLWLCWRGRLAHGFGDAHCWFGPFTYDLCCSRLRGPTGNDACWEGVFTFERCCAVDPCSESGVSRSCRQLAAADASLILEATHVVSARGLGALAGMLRSTNAILERKFDVGLDPLASTRALAGQRLSGLPGYGQPGQSAWAYYELACRSRTGLLPASVMKNCSNLVGSFRFEQADMERKVSVLKTIRHLHENILARGEYLFRLALELIGLAQITGGDCGDRGLPLSRRLADEFHGYHVDLAGALEGLRLLSPHMFVGGLGTPLSIVAERMGEEGLLDPWNKLVGVIARDYVCFDLVMSLVQVTMQIIETGMRLSMNAFAHFFVAELISRRSAAQEDVSVLTSQRIVFQSRVRCCLRYHILLDLVQSLVQTSVSMVEIGVHTATTSIYLLDRAPNLKWSGVDPYSGYGDEGAADDMFLEAADRLRQFGPRASLHRVPSSIAWNGTGGLLGLQPGSVDILFVDGDHDFEVTKRDLLSWSRLVRPGGIVSGHDIFNPVNDGVTDAVFDVLRGTHTTLKFATDHFYWWQQG